MVVGLEYHKKPPMTLAALLELDDEALVAIGVKKSDQRQWIVAFPGYVACAPAPSRPETTRG